MEAEAHSRLNKIQVELMIVNADLVVDDVRNVLVSARVSHPSVARIVVGRVSAADLCDELARLVGAYMYLLKRLQAQQLRMAVNRALELSELARRHRLLSQELKSPSTTRFSHALPLSVDGGMSQFEKLVYISSKMAEFN